MNPFVLILFAVAAAVISLLGFRLTGLGSGAWVMAVGLIAIIFLYPAIWFGMVPRKLEPLLRPPIHYAMGLVSFLIGLLVLRDLIFLPWSLFQPEVSLQAYSAEGTWAVITLAVCLLFYGLWHAAREPKLIEVEIPVADLPASLSGFSIVQISDLHAGPSIDKKFVDRIVRRSLELKPNAVVLTGDIADGSFETYSPEIASLAELTKQFPCYYVTGNHEYMKDSGPWIRHFQSLGIKALLNEHATLTIGNSQVVFAGILDPEARHINPRAVPSIEDAMKGSPSAALNILLSHRPAVMPGADTRFQLQVSGHTHGGQFFPWNFVIHLAHKYSKGLYKQNGMWIYVSQGTGFWGPPIRVGTRSELTVFRFRAAATGR